MSFLTDKTNRKELYEIISTQKDKLQRYEARLGDLIRAYKGIQKEKEVLEASLKALAGPTGTARESQDLKEASSPVVPQDEGEEIDTSDSTDQPGSGSSETTSQSQEAKGEDYSQPLSTLSSALATLTVEKSKMEAGFQADKKKLIQEKEAVQKKLDELEKSHRIEIKTLEDRVQELKLKVREQQQEREQEQQDHAVMLRELQRLVAEERVAKEVLEKKLEEAMEKVRESAKAKEYEIKIQNLTQELQGVQKRLKASEDKVEEPSPLLLKLQKELDDIKTQHQVAIDKESKRANTAEETLKSQATGSEERVANLEARLSELSEMLGNYDRLRQQDLQAIQKLKERVAQLDLENSALVKAVGGDTLDAEDSNLDIRTLMDRFSKLRRQLKESNQRSEKAVDLKAYFKQMAEEEVVNLHSKCHEELRQLKEEFERYKVRAQSVLKNKSVKDTDSVREVEVLRNQVSELQCQIRALRLHQETEEEHSKSVAKQLQANIVDMKLKHRNELANLESQWRTKLSEIEQQMQKQRERSLALIEEKDREIQLLKPNVAPLLLELTKESSKFENKVSSSSDSSQLRNLTSQENDPLSELLSSSFGKTKIECQILHYAHELARKDAELANLLKTKHETESALRELQHSALIKERKHLEEIEALQRRNRQLESYQSREGINLEYLKNVVLQYILCRDGAKQHMLNAIAAVLHFTAREVELVREANLAWW